MAADDAQGSGSMDTLKKVVMFMLVLALIAGIVMIVIRLMHDDKGSASPAPSVGGGGGSSSTSPPGTSAPTGPTCAMERVTSGGDLDGSQSLKAFVVPISKFEGTADCMRENDMCASIFGEDEATCKSLCVASSQCQAVGFTGGGVKCTFYSEYQQSGGTSGPSQGTLFKKNAYCPVG